MMAFQTRSQATYPSYPQSPQREACSRYYGSYNSPPQSPKAQPNNNYQTSRNQNGLWSFSSNVVTPEQRTSHNYGLSPSSSPQALTSSKNNGLTQNQSNPRKSPVMTPRGWGSRTPIDRGYNHSYTSPSSSEVSSNESLQLPSFVGRGYENVPNLSPQQMTQPRYQRAVDARRKQKNRENKEKLINCQMENKLERNATSTRKIRAEKKGPNHQTINAFKLKLDHNREKIAKGRALELLNMLH